MRLEELNALSEDPNLWNDSMNGQKLMRERTRLDDSLNAVQSINQELNEAVEIIELDEMDSDEANVTEAEAQL